MLYLLTLSALLVAVAGQNDNPSYFIVAPKTIRPGRMLDLSVNIMRGTGDVVVEACVQRNYNTSKITDIVKKEQKFSIGQKGIIQLQIPDTLTAYGNMHRRFKYPYPSEFIVKVKGIGGLTFENKGDLTFNRKSFSIFVQTDKAMYKPGQKVLFRVFAINQELKPFRGTFNIEIYDKANNKVKQWLNVQKPSGVFNGDLQLPEKAVQGDWKIKVKAKGETKQKTFKVEEYVLPKFEVSVKLPSYWLASNTAMIPITIVAKYTYGKPVKGKAVVRIKFNGKEGKHYQEYYLIKKMEDTIELTDGKGELKKSLKEIKALFPVYCWDHTLRRRKPESECKDENPRIGYSTLKVEASVTETLTGVVLSGDSLMPFKSEKYTIEFLSATPPTFKPALKYTAFVKVSQPDGQPLEPKMMKLPSGENRNLTCNVKFKLNDRNIVEWKETFTYDVPASGIVVVSFDVHKKAENFNEFKCTYDGQSARKYGVTKFQSRSKQGMQIGMNVMGNIKAGQTVQFEVKTTNGSTPTFWYQILSKGTVITTNKISNSKTFSITVDGNMARQLAPSGRIVVWYVYQGEVISDSLDFNVDGAFANDVAVTFSTNDTKPGKKLDVTVKADAGSYVGLLAVDQSVLLLAGGNDVSQNDVLSELRQYDSRTGGPMPMFYRCYYCWWPISAGGSDSKKVFDNAGLNVFTDAFIYEQKNSGPYYPSVRRGIPGPAGPVGVRGQAGPAGPVAERGRTGSPGGAPGGAPPAAPRTRKLFPETWLWTEVDIGRDGKHVINTKVPDTITSWVATAFAMHPTSGLGITPAGSKVRVFKPFFISLTMPYSILRKEQFGLTVTVFNYLKTQQEVKVTLMKSDDFFVYPVKSSEFKVEEVKAKPVVADVTKDVQVPAGDGKSIYFWVVPKKVGNLLFSVRAISPEAGDALERTLIVEPEGTRQEINVPMFVDLTKESKFSKKVPIQFPKQDMVEGSEHIQVSVIGDVMGPSLQNLDRLIRMPYGCGEQNMLKFAPNIHVLKYLKATAQTNKEIEAKAIKYMESGYMRELTYQRNDASFSAFGNRDSVGSMWLTAFVVKSFHKAKSYITIDENKVNQAVNWIVRHQHSSGRFDESAGGRVIHSAMQGGSTGLVSMTAYVMSALLEVQSTDNKVKAAITKAEEFLVKHLEDYTDNAYVMAILSYAFSLAKSRHAATAMQHLETLAKTEDGKKYWSATKTPKATRYYYRPRARSLDVETTAYALLTYNMGKPVTAAVPIVKWLASQRNAYGGYASTQDTVMAIQALAGFAEKFSDPDKMNLKVQIAAGSFKREFTVNKQNSVLLQTAQVPKESDHVIINAAGQGVAMVQVTWSFHVTKVTEEPTIETEVLVEDKDKTSINTTVCARWKGDKESGMVVMSIGQLSGYEPDVQDLQKNYQKSMGVKMTEINGRTVDIYVDGLANEKKCLSMNSFKREEVSNLQMAKVVVYEYYDPENAATKFYRPESAASTAKVVNICAACPSCAGCNSTTGTEGPISQGVISQTTGVLILAASILLTLFLRQH